MLKPEFPIKDRKGRNEKKEKERKRGGVYKESNICMVCRNKLVKMGIQAHTAFKF